jgi:hypothetical protein
MTSHGLLEVVANHPETRAQVVGILTAQLSRREPKQYGLIASMVSDLLDLDAVESAEVIERAFAAGVVDEGCIGNFEKVREELGVEGLGLPQPKKPYNSMEFFRNTMRAKPPAVLEERRKQKQKLAAKLKQARKRRK